MKMLIFMNKLSFNVSQLVAFGIIWLIHQNIDKQDFIELNKALAAMQYHIRPLGSF